MNLRKSFALLMCVAIAVWIAAPALACFAEGNVRSQHDCCAVMQTCDAAMSSSCCQLAPKSNSPVTTTEFSLQHDPQPALLSHSAVLPSLADSKSGQQWRQSISVPEPSSGRFLVLRI